MLSSCMRASTFRALHHFPCSFHILPYASSAEYQINLEMYTQQLLQAGSVLLHQVRIDWAIIGKLMRGLSQLMLGLNADQLANA